MADLPYIQEAQEVKITGQDSVGDTVNYVGADTNGNLLTKDYSDGPVTPGTAASSSLLIGTQYNSTLPILTSTQQAAIQSDANGALIISTKVPRTYSVPQTASVGTTSTLILAANTARKGLYLSNTSTQAISFGFNGNAAAYQYGITLYPGEKFWMDEYSFSTGAIYAITTGAGTYIGIQEIT